MRNDWQENGSCLNLDTNLFFDKYEDNRDIRKPIDKLCSECPVRRECLATAVSRQEWGVWGGVYFEKGKISKEFNDHKTEKDWFHVWSALTLETL